MLDYRNAAMADHDNIHLLLNAALESNDPEVAQLARPTTAPCTSWCMACWSRPKNKGLLSARLDLTAATWGTLSFLFALQYRGRANIFEEFNEQTIREINRLWLQALRTA